MKTDDLINYIINETNKLNDFIVYYATRQYKVKRILQSLQIIKVCIVLDKLDLPITSTLVSAITGESFSTMSMRLHTLGDKHILVLKRKLGQRNYEWILHPAFKALIANHSLKTEKEETKHE